MSGQTEVDETLESVSVVLKAMADPNRLRILALLLQADSCNGELNERLGLPPNLLSHHLRILRQAGLIKSRRDRIDGRWIYYSVDRAVVGRWQGWLSNFLDSTRTQQRCLCGPEASSIARADFTGAS
ncbi:MAG TPA: metalloregulator ArsR/SmtB family transcription factor [Anaerolineae bacterium]|mgnify:CR=1 FL=1|nr:metalloregulator ArsR/SmtB family transcription factor [Anaerolineae bacterium]